MMRLFVLLLSVGLLAPVTAPMYARAQGLPPPSPNSTSPEKQAAILVADDVQITADDKLVATGNVEAMFEAARATMG